VLWALLVVLLFGGCGAATSESTEVSPVLEPTAIEVGEDEAVRGPTLADRVGFDLADEDAMSAWFDEAEIEWRRLTAECMRAEGFEYSQEDWASPGALPTDFSRSSREFAETFGFGVVPAFLAATYDPAAVYEGPNAVYVESLAPAERDEYFMALVGSAEGENETENGFPLAGRGWVCWYRAGDSIRELQQPPCCHFPKRRRFCLQSQRHS